MPTLETLTQTDLNQVINTKSLKRSRGYLTNVRQPQRFGNSLAARVGKSRLYNIEIEVDEQGIHAHCSCPYSWGGYCKHIGAVLLKWIQSPDTFVLSEAKPTPSTPIDYPIEVVPVKPPKTHRPKQQPLWLTQSLTDRWQREKKQLTQWLEMLMIEPTEIEQAVHNLDTEHAQVFRAMLLLGNEAGVQADDLTRVATHWGKLTKYKQTNTYSSHLNEMGLSISGEFQYSYPPRLDFVPRSLIRHCPPPLETVLDVSPDMATDLPQAQLRLADPLGFVRKIHQLILMLEQNPTALRPPMPRPKMEKFYAALADWNYDPHELAGVKTQKPAGYTDLTLAVPPPDRLLPDEALDQLVPIAGSKAELDFMLALLTAIGVFQPGSPITIWPEVKEQFLRQPELAQRAVLARTYFSMENWSELWDVLRHEPQLHLRRSLVYSHNKPMSLQVDLAQFRNVVLRVLAGLPSNRWLKIDELLPLLKTIWPSFDQSRYNPSHFYYPSQQKPAWYLAQTSSDKPLDLKDEANWQLAQGNFIVQLITGPLHWLGLIDVYENDGQPVEIRLHGLADLYWDRVDAPAAPHPTLSQSAAATPAEAMTIDGETISINPTAVSTQMHNLLDTLARLDEVLPDRFVYTLDVEAAHATFEAGQTLANITTRWEELLAQPMPEHILARLESWWQGYGQVRIYENITVIEFSDDYALSEMKAVTSLSQQLIAEISPRLVLIPVEAVARLTSELERAGYTPKQTNKV